MALRVVGAGLPRTGTSSLKEAFEHLLGGRCYHMSAIPGHPFDLGEDWDRALADEAVEWERMCDGYIAAVDWPASMFWRELSQANPEALVLLSVRDTAETWQQSFEETVLLTTRMALTPGWSEGRGVVSVLERFIGREKWDDPAALRAAYEWHNAEVRQAIPPDRLLVWQAAEGWGPICQALGLPTPDVPFPWISRRSEWG